MNKIEDLVYQQFLLKQKLKAVNDEIKKLQEENTSQMAMNFTVRKKPQEKAA